MKKVVLLIVASAICFSCKTSEQLSAPTPPAPPATVKPVSPVNNLNSSPKLVVGIVVDQMRYDYLNRFYNRFSDGGFKRLMTQGFNFKNNHYNYVPTYTGPGHASIYTGTTPKYHGIISNYWYDKTIDKSVYCASDNTVKSVGIDHVKEQMSPRRLMSTTFGDENRLFTEFKGKTIGIAIKDRGAILPAGHTANAAYWFHGKDLGKWISSTYYMNQLPDWVKNFNAKPIAESYLKPWTTLYDIDTYVESGDDLNAFERGFEGKDTATFPYDLNVLKDKNEGFDILKATAYGNALTADFAIAALDGENLGGDAITDVLTVSFSSTDYVGHNFGVNSKEIQDTYLRLDKDLERLFAALDAKVGKGQYTVFLTADHGAVNVPSYLKSVNIPAGYVDDETHNNTLKAFLKAKFNTDNLIKNISNNQIFLNHEVIKNNNLNLGEIQEAIVDEMIAYKDIDKAYTAKTMAAAPFAGGMELLLQNGYNQKKSGDVLYVYSPAYITYSKTGSTHGSGLSYDTHVPLLFYGKGVKQGSSFTKTAITDIAPTISALLGTSFPNRAIGEPLVEVLK